MFNRGFITTAGRSGRTGFLARILRDAHGNALPIIAASILPLLALVGGGIDMSRSYLSETRLQQACDAGVLAARKRLGSSAVITGEVPDTVAESGNAFFNTNFHEGDYGSANTAFEMTLEDDYSISGEATVDVPTTVMQIFGDTHVPVHVECNAQLNFSNTDIMMVLDVTGSMTQTNPDDSEPKIDILRQVVKDFHAQLEAAKGPGIRLRYGFVPYSTNVNVGGLLEDDWVVDNWTYQSREFDHSVGGVTDHTYWANFVWQSGSSSTTNVSTYAATWHPATYETGSGYYSCDTSPPGNTGATDYTLLSTTTEPYVGPPAGTKTTKHYRRVINGAFYWVSRSGTTCTVKRDDYSSYTDEYDQITIPVSTGATFWRYAPIARDVTNWRSESNGCIEERSTYEIDDYDNVDFTRALDLDIDMVPIAGDPDTQWRPMYPNIIYERKLSNRNSNNFQVAEQVSSQTYFMPAWENGLIACPKAAQKLAEMSATDVANYVDSIVPMGATYHDIGMIWGGRLISPTGIFAADNANVGGKKTSRHLIFLTDGETHPYDVSYSTYGVEPLDRRRRDPDSPALGLSPTQVIEKRFGVACSEVRKRNITVWVVSFGTEMTDMLRSCAGDDHAFMANNAEELQQAFTSIAKAMGDLRIER